MFKRDNLTSGREGIDLRNDIFYCLNELIEMVLLKFC